MGRGVAAIEPGSVVAVIFLLQDILEIFILDAPFRTCGPFLVFQDVCIVLMSGATVTTANFAKTLRIME